ncbi:MAG: glycosyltransferase [bacterium]
MSDITFLVFTYNEEKRIEYVVRNFINHGDVLILDDGSTDRTKEIAESYGARVVVRPKTDIYHTENQTMYQFILSQIKTNWIFWGYADNILPKSLLDKMTEITKQDQFKYVNIPTNTYLWGVTDKVIHKGYSPRFFRKDAMDFTDNKLHGMGKFLGKEDEKLKLLQKDEYAMYHFSTYNLQKFISSHLTYAQVEAEQKFQDGKKFSLVRLFAAMVRYFVMFIRHGFKLGSIGVIVGLMYAFFRVMTYVSLYEKENGITLDIIEDSYAKKKEELLKQIKV